MIRSGYKSCSTRLSRYLLLLNFPLPTAVIIDDTILSIEANSELERAIRIGEEELNQVLSSMGLKVTVEEETKAKVVPTGEYN